MSQTGFLQKDNIPGIKKIVLPNGIKVFLEELPEHKKVMFMLGVGVGSKDETPEIQGISHFVEHIQFHSNRFRMPEEITEDVEEGGAGINAGTEFDFTVFEVFGYPRYFSRNVRILYEAINNFEYNETEIEREKCEILSEFRMYLDSPEDYYITNLFIPALLRKTHSERSILGIPKTIKRLTREDLTDFKRKFYIPGNMAIFVCGKFEEVKVLKIIEKTFGRLRARPFYPQERKIFLINRRREYFKKRKSLKLAYLAIGYKVPSFNYRDSLKLMLLDFIISGGMSCRLSRKLKSEKGIGYRLGSVYDDYADIGVFYVRIGGFDPRRFKEAKSIILKEFEDLRTNLVSKREFLRAKNLFISEVDDALEDLETRADFLLRAYFRNDFFDYRNYKREISKISREAIRRTAQKYFDQRYTLTALVPENFIK